MTIHHVTFTTMHYYVSALRLAESAARFGIETRIYTRRSAAVRRLAEKHAEIMRQGRGAGYWLWKPAIILDAMGRAKDGDHVLYTDAGLALLRDPRELVARAPEDDIVLFEHWRCPGGEPSLPNRHWTKRDCFVLMDADGPEFWDDQQLSAAIQLYRVCDAARAFLEECLTFGGDARILTDQPNTQGKDNLPGFRDHRHDQSVLTILARKHRVRRLTDPACDGWRGAGSPRLINHHRGHDARLVQVPLSWTRYGLGRWLGRGAAS